MGRQVGRCFVVTGVALVALVACSADDGASSTTPAAPTVSSTSTASGPSSTDEPSSGAPATSRPDDASASSAPTGSVTAPDTTAVEPPAGAATDTTLPVTAPTQGWAMAALPAWATIPCCASEWPVAEPSPPLPAPADPLPDGVYRFEVVPWGWTTDDPGRVRIRVTRFDVCGTPPNTDIWCESGDPDELGESYGQAIEFSVALDEDVTVGFTGAACAPDGTGPARQGWVGDGPALQELWLEVDSVFEREVRPLFTSVAGWPPIMHELATGSSFTANLCSPAAGDEVYHVAYESTAGPTLLYQGPGASHGASSGFEGWQLLRPATIEVRGGRILLMFEQCYQS